MHTVLITKGALKNLKKAPERIKLIFDLLIMVLKHKGPILNNWSNFSKIGKNKYHCHLKHKWVACWKCEKNSIIIEVYYVGSRENAPY